MKDNKQKLNARVECTKKGRYYNLTLHINEGSENEVTLQVNPFVNNMPKKSISKLMYKINVAINGVE